MKLHQIVALVAITVMTTSVLAAPAADEVPKEIQKALEAAMQAKIDELAKDKDADGNPTKRGNYSRFFKKADDTTYTTAFTLDTITPDRMTVERSTATLKQSGDKWEITDLKLEDTLNNLYRSVPGDEKFSRFQSFSFEREGLKVTTGPGVLISDTWNGQTFRLSFAAADMRYDYKPPADVTTIQAGHIWQAYLAERDKAPDLVFSPTFIDINCDPLTCEQMLKENFSGLSNASAGDLPAVARTWYDDEIRDAKQGRKDNPFGGFNSAPPYLLGGAIGFFNADPDPSHHWQTVGIQKQGGKQWFVLNYDNWTPWEVQVGTYNETDWRKNRFPILGYYSEETRKSGKQEWELEMRNDPSDRDFELEAVSGTVELALADDEAMKADVTFVVNAKRDINYIPFFVATVRNPGDEERKANKPPRVIINSLQDGDGHDLTYARLGGNFALVKLPETLKQGQQITLRTQFTNQTAIYKLNYSYSGLSRGGWLPFVRFGDMIPNFELTIKVPKQYTVLGIGKRMWDKVEDGVMVSHWKANFPVTFPTIIFGDYISDRPTELPKRLNGQDIPVAIYVDKNGMTDWDIRPKQLIPVADQAAQAMKLFTFVYQRDYPYDELNLVNDPLGSFYGQSPASLIYLGSGVFRGEGTLASFTGGGSNITLFNKDVVAHEVAHQWWGSLITNSNQRNYWFVETMAELSSALYVEKAYGRKRYLEKVEEWRQTVMERNLMQGVQYAAVLDSGDSFGSYQAAVYNKGPLAMHTLRETFGDEKFFQFLRAMARELQGKEIVTRDMQRISEKVYGGDMNWFWDQWIRGAGMPEYKWTHTVRETEDGQWLVEGKILQRVVIGLKRHVADGLYYKTAMPVSITYSDGTTKKYPVYVEGATSTFRLKVPQKPSKVLLAAENEALATSITVGSSW